ncbi:MAG: oxidoreductase, partial [Nitrospinaceae bacterium]|nr:oxidoreductase [Nitrospinaceae bacterium]NIW07498.1 oxidoreductase [Nitrospinaceae bacterium]NIY17110.1 oxidoreductase [Nitrospinaceae bacterium]
MNPGCGWAGNPGDLKLNVPDDIQLTVFAPRVRGARHMAFDDQGILFLSQRRQGSVVALPDLNRDGKADSATVIYEEGEEPHGLAFVQLDSGYYLYVAEEHRVFRLKRTGKPFTYGKPEVIVPDIPTGGHSTRTIKIKDGRLYLSTGSSCNVCIEDNPLRAAIWRYDLDGKNGKL